MRVEMFALRSALRTIDDVVGHTASRRERCLSTRRESCVSTRVSHEENLVSSAACGAPCNAVYFDQRHCPPPPRARGKNGALLYVRATRGSPQMLGALRHRRVARLRRLHPSFAAAGARGLQSAHATAACASPLANVPRRAGRRSARPPRAQRCRHSHFLPLPAKTRSPQPIQAAASTKPTSHTCRHQPVSTPLGGTCWMMMDDSIGVGFSPDRHLYGHALLRGRQCGGP